MVDIIPINKASLTIPLEKLLFNIGQVLVLINENLQSIVNELIKIKNT